MTRSRWEHAPWPGPLEPLRITAVAAQFLTRLPVPQIPVVDGDLRRATAAFPFVGLLIGGIAWLVYAGTSWLLGPLVAAVAAVAAAAGVTGAFHEDGLADTFDGLWGGWDPEQRIRIMRDSRLGTYGALALLLVVLAQVALLAELDVPGAARALIAGHVVSRAVILVQIRALPAVSDQGSGAQVAAPLSGVGLVVAVVVTALVLGLTAGRFAGVLLASALVAVAVLRRAARRRLGGLTGDILGATQQLALLLVVAAVLAIDSRWAW
ncbi:MAG: adenosylcobinamide-GDP ribazoletransferase [Nitriliruptoraceae bacterium]|nr:adenosylcobinamide-GDP ribazoletransferase [Nitriliruptoraceae bacterium]